MRGKTWVAACLVIVAALFFRVGAARAAGDYRALLVSCDHFVSHPDTAPSAGNNAAKLAETLARWSGYANVRTVSDRVSGADELGAQISECFMGARDDDVSLFYISTHGVVDEAEQYALVLSDGEREELLTADSLRTLFSGVRGHKVLILDACASGGLIGRGVDESVVRHAFTGGEFTVLTSSGGNEDSWYWQSEDSGEVQGGSFFADALAIALGYFGVPTADANHDGIITMGELYETLLQDYAVSTPQVYPMNSDLTVMMWDTATPQAASVTDVVFDMNPLSVLKRDIAFSFTIMRKTHLIYRIVYYLDDMWQFRDAQSMSDDTEGFDEPLLTPGRKTRTLTLRERDLTTSGHVMLQLLAREGSGYVSYNTRLLLVEPGVGDPNPQVLCAPFFNPGRYEELPVIVHTDIPCRLSLVVRDAQGLSVRRLAYRQSTRPALYHPDGMSFCWDGRMTDGQFAPPGTYTIEVSAVVDDQTVTANVVTVEVM